MTSSHVDQTGASGDDDRVAFLARALRFVDGELDQNELALFESELRADDQKLAAFAKLQTQACMLRNALRRQAFALDRGDRLASGAPSHRVAATDRKSTWRTMAALVAIGLFAMFTYWLGRSNRPSQTIVGTQPQVETEESINSSLVNVTLASASGASFFGERTPKSQTLLDRDHEYILTGGLIELRFSTGAEVIVESPAVFRLPSDNALAMDAGGCSVYAPDGAEGFEVQTPTTRVVDRGTRFLVTVGENADTEVQVVEGAADVYAMTNAREGMRLTDGDAKRYLSDHVEDVKPVAFTPERYRRSLPDRVVRYQAKQSASGVVDELQGITVQRGGKLQTFAVDELIGVQLTHFRSSSMVNPNGHLAAPTLPDNRLSLLSDHRLDTAIINPGGSATPLSGTPQSDTPGLGIRFDSPVVNGPGPDVVFFELQCMSNPIGGDAFHVVPLPMSRFTAGQRKPLTIGNYDLTLASSEAQQVAEFNLFRGPQPIDSMDQLLIEKVEPTTLRLTFRAIAVGIDLSDLGLAIGESLDELFIQDALDDESIVDPCFIAGLPED